MDSEIKELLERGVAAIELLAQDPVIDMPAKPPVCPHCDRINPTIRVGESEETGAMSEFVIRCHCLHCNQVFMAIPLLWDCVTTIEQVQQIISERAEIGGYNNKHKE